MLKTMFEQFINEGAKFIYHIGSSYFYGKGGYIMRVDTNATFPYTPKDIELLIHRDMIKIERIVFR